MDELKNTRRSIRLPRPRDICVVTRESAVSWCEWSADYCSQSAVIKSDVHGDLTLSPLVDTINSLPFLKIVLQNYSNKTITPIVLIFHKVLRKFVFIITKKLPRWKIETGSSSSVNKYHKKSIPFYISLLQTENLLSSNSNQDYYEGIKMNILVCDGH